MTGWRRDRSRRDPPWTLRGMAARSSSFRESRELLRHPLVDRALERHDHVGEPRELLPAPCFEFRLMAAGGMADVDLALVSRETQPGPFLPLPAGFSRPRPPHHPAP